MRKKLLIVSIIFSMLCSMNITAQAATNSETSSYNLFQIKECIEDFFYVYEDMENKDDASNLFNTIKKIVSDENETIQSFTNKKNTQTLETKSYINTIQYMLQRKEYIKKNSDIDEKEYNKKLDIKITDFSKQNNSIEVEVEVYKTWNYSFSKDIESAARDTYKISLTIENGNYVIQNITGFGNSIFDETLNANNDEISQNTKNEMLNEFKDNFTTELEQHNNEIKLEQQYATAKVANTYDGADASRYALKYALDYNKNYADFNSSGGDCTNFISQCLKAGGISQHIGTAYSGDCWFYKTSTNRSSTWTGAEQFRKYITGSSSKIKMSVSDWGNVENGDIIQLMSGGNAYHSLIISGVAYSSSGRSDLLVCCHSTDRRHVSLTSNFAGRTKKYYHIKGNK